MAEASTTSASAMAVAELFPLGVDGGKDLLVGYLEAREPSETAQPFRSIACAQLTTQRRLRDIGNAHPGGASLSGEGRF